MFWTGYSLRLLLLPISGGRGSIAASDWSSTFRSGVDAVTPLNQEVFITTPAGSAVDLDFRTESLTSQLGNPSLDKGG